MTHLTLSHNNHPTKFLTALSLLFLAACGAETSTEYNLVANNSESSATIITAPQLLTLIIGLLDWLAHGRTWSEQRFSPLEEINTDTVENLSLSWYVDLPEVVARSFSNHS